MAEHFTIRNAYGSQNFHMQLFGMLAEYLQLLKLLPFFL